MQSGRRGRSHAEACIASAGTRLRWNMPMCVQTQELRSTALSAPDFPETRQKLKKEQKNANPNFFNLNFYLFLDFIYTKAQNK
jgi:hypothetical protein